MHVQVAVLLEGTGPVGEELPALLANLAGLGRLLELVAGPHDGPLGGRVEPVRIEQGALVVVAQENQPAVHDEVDALARIGSVPDHVAEAIDSLIHVLLADVVQHRAKGFQITVDIADDRLHAGTSWESAAGDGLWPPGTSGPGGVLKTLFSQSIAEREVLSRDAPDYESPPGGRPDRLCRRNGPHGGGGSAAEFDAHEQLRPVDPRGLGGGLGRSGDDIPAVAGAKLEGVLAPQRQRQF